MVHVTRLRRQLRTRKDDEAGALAVVVGVSAVMIFVLAAMVVDLGLARDTDAQAQTGADASALAGATALYTLGKTPHWDDSVNAVKDYARDNYGVPLTAWAGCIDSQPLSYQYPAAGTSCISFDDATLPTQVRVVMPTRDVKTPLGSLAGTSQVSIAAVAQAHITPNAGRHCALCVIGPGPHDLHNGSVEVGGGDIHFNGNVSVGPNGLVATDGSITVQGTANGGLEKYDPDPLTSQPAIPDPLAFLPRPDYTSLTAKSDPCTDGPGIYGGWSGNCASMPPGLYVITGRWDFSGNENVTGNGVTLFFTCGNVSAPAPCTGATGESSGWLDSSGGGRIVITAPTSGPYEGLAIMYDRKNRANLELTGNGNSLVQGTIYAPSATMWYRGNGTGTPDSLVVVGSLSFNGNATMAASYDDDQNVPMPPVDLYLSK